MAFETAEFLPETVLRRLTEVRLSQPSHALELAQSRRLCDDLESHTRLVLVRAEPRASRASFMSRLVRTLLAPSVSGVVATMDVIEDLLLLEQVVLQAGGAPFLQGKLVFCTLRSQSNGMVGAEPETCQRWKLDGGALPWDARGVAGADHAHASTVVTDMARRGFRLIVDLADGSEDMERGVRCAQMLGESSMHMLLSVPLAGEMEAVVQGATVPVLAAARDDVPWDALGAQLGLLANVPQVRGTIVGESVLYPSEDDPRAAAEHVAKMARGATQSEASESAEMLSGEDMDYFTSTIGA